MPRHIYIIEGHMLVGMQVEKISTLVRSYFMAESLKQQYKLLGFEQVTIDILDSRELPNYLKGQAL